MSCGLAPNGPGKPAPSMGSGAHVRSLCHLEVANIPDDIAATLPARHKLKSVRDVMYSGWKAVLEADLRAAHATFKDLILRISAPGAGLPIEGEWSAKDLAAHVSSWDELVYLDLRRVARSHVPVVSLFYPDAIDYLNTVLMRGRKSLSRRQVLLDLDECYVTLQQVIGVLSDAFFETGLVGDRLVRSQILHYGLHSSTLGGMTCDAAPPNITIGDRFEQTTLVLSELRAPMPRR